MGKSFKRNTTANRLCKRKKVQWLVNQPLNLFNLAF
jgi:hypothetical protein